MWSNGLKKLQTSIKNLKAFNFVPFCIFIYTSLWEYRLTPYHDEELDGIHSNKTLQDSAEFAYTV